MNRLVNLAVTLAVLASLLVAAPAAAAGRPVVDVRFNGHPVLFDVEPQVVNGRSLVPFRKILEAMGAEVAYDASTQEITATRSGRTVKLTIDSTTAYVDGNAVSLEVAPVLMAGRTLVPMRFLSEALGVRVDWDGDTRVANLVDNEWPKRGGTVHQAMWSEPEEKFNPIISQSYYDSLINNLVFDSLFFLDDQWQPRPSMATHWDISDDNKIFTFYLRPGIKWHDGTEFTAEDVRYTFEMLTHPDYKGPGNIGYDSLVGYDEFHAGQTAHLSGIEVLDKYTVRFTLNKVHAPFLYSVGYTGMIARHLYCPEDSYSACTVPVADLGTDRDPHRTHPIGTGPYKWSKGVTSQYYELDAYDGYHLGRPYVDRLIWKVLAQETAVMHLGTGTVDVADVDRTELAVAESMDNITITEYPDLVWQYLGFNVLKEPFNDSEVRKAVAWAIDREAIVNDLIQGHASVLYTPIHPLQWAYAENVEKYPYSPEKASSLLQAAGWQLGSDGVRVKDGQRLSLELLYPSGNAVRMNTAPLIAQQLKAVGFDVTLSKLDFPTLLTKIGGNEHQAFLLAWKINSPDPNQLDVFGKDQIGPDLNNMYNWWTAISEDLLHKGVETLDVEERMTIYEAWQQHVMNEELPVLPLYAPNRILGVNKRLHNYRPTPISELWNSWEWWVEN